jgi:hypothetical protein
MLNMQNLDRLACLTGSLAKYVISFSHIQLHHITNIHNLKLFSRILAKVAREDQLGTGNLNDAAVAVFAL